VVERDRDQLMARTHDRPLPAGEIVPSRALAFGVVLNIVAFVGLSLAANLLAACLTMAATLFYVFVYTIWLKRTSTRNIVIGGAAGAVPVLVGWAAVTDSLSWTPVVLFAVIFFWTPPHFWALSLLIRKHYERAGVPMLPVVRGEDETRRQIVLYSVLLVVLTLVLTPFGVFESWWGVLLALPSRRCGLQAAAAIQVITADAIRRSGATSIPEALRPADNLEVAQINSHDWAISARIRAESPVPVYLAGGLNASNVGEAIATVEPFGVDVCSGVRTNGKLDVEKLSAFVDAVAATS